VTYTEEIFKLMLDKEVQNFQCQIQKSDLFGPKHKYIGQLVTDRCIPYAYDLNGAAALLASAAAVTTKTKGGVDVVNLVRWDSCS